LGASSVQHGMLPTSTQDTHMTFDNFHMLRLGSNIHHHVVTTTLIDRFS
jgi:hypothetical protein